MPFLLSLFQSFFNNIHNICQHNKKSSGDLKLKLTAYKNVYTLFYRMLHLYTAQWSQSTVWRWRGCIWDSLFSCFQVCACNLLQATNMLLATSRLAEEAALCHVLRKFKWLGRLTDWDIPLSICFHRAGPGTHLVIAWCHKSQSTPVHGTFPFSHSCCFHMQLIRVFQNLLKATTMEKITFLDWILK